MGARAALGSVFIVAALLSAGCRSRDFHALPLEQRLAAAEDVRFAAVTNDVVAMRGGFPRLALDPESSFAMRIVLPTMEPHVFREALVAAADEAILSRMDGKRALESLLAALRVAESHYGPARLYAGDAPFALFANALAQSGQDAEMMMRIRVHGRMDALFQRVEKDNPMPNSKIANLLQDEEAAPFGRAVLLASTYAGSFGEADKGYARLRVAFNAGRCPAALVTRSAAPATSLEDAIIARYFELRCPGLTAEKPGDRRLGNRFKDIDGRFDLSKGTVVERSTADDIWKEIENTVESIVAPNEYVVFNAMSFRFEPPGVPFVPGAPTRDYAKLYRSNTGRFVSLIRDKPDTVCGFFQEGKTQMLNTPYGNVRETGSRMVPSWEAFRLSGWHGSLERVVIPFVEDVPKDWTPSKHFLRFLGVDVRAGLMFRLPPEKGAPTGTQRFRVMVPAGTRDAFSVMQMVYQPGQMVVFTRDFARPGKKDVRGIATGNDWTTLGRYFDVPQFVPWMRAMEVNVAQVLATPPDKRDEPEFGVMERAARRCLLENEEKSL